MKYFILIFIIFFSITLFGQRSGGRIGGRSFDKDLDRTTETNNSSTTLRKTSTDNSKSSNSADNSNDDSSSSSSTTSSLFKEKKSSSKSTSNSSNNYNNTNYKETNGNISTRLILLFIFAGGGFIFLAVFLSKGNKKNKPKPYNPSFSDTIYNTIKIQFAFHATIYNLRKQFIEVAEKLNFDNQFDLRQLIINFANLTEENNSYIKYGDLYKSSDYKTKVDIEKVHNEFVEDELDKLSEETYLKIENHKSVVKQLKEENKPEFTEIKEYIVFTLIVTYRNLNIEKKDDYSYQYYSSVLNKLKLINLNDILAVEVIWTPDAENDVLTEDDIIMNYNNLKTV